MAPIDQVIATYFRAWNDRTPEGCARHLAESCAPEVAYVDPRYTCRGVGELAARILRTRGEAPHCHVAVTSAVDGYDDTYRYAWVFVVADDGPRIPGLDVVVRAGDGRIATITSFFGALGTIAAGAPTHLQKRWGT
jgi:hypothetical protein